MITASPMKASPGKVIATGSLYSCDHCFPFIRTTHVGRYSLPRRVGCLMLPTKNDKKILGIAAT